MLLQPSSFSASFNPPSRRICLKLCSKYIALPTLPKTLSAFSASDLQPQLLCLTFKILSHPFLPVVHSYLQYKVDPRKAFYPPPAERTGTSLFRVLIGPSSPRTVFVFSCQKIPTILSHQYKVFSPCPEALALVSAPEQKL